ncbi:MAG: MBL fold metallo-hydrolase [Chloroflexi bacterium]|nr:MBL fold metallo-hydrolase [Chloroflexota bacterium]
MTSWPASVHQITLPTPFPVGPVHVYLLEGEPLTLLDTGPRTPEALQELEARLAALGHGVSDLQRIVISHAHADHYGLAATLAERSGARILAHPHCAARLSGDEESGGSLRWYAGLLKAAGVPLAVQLRVAGGFRHVNRHSRAVPVDHLLDEGDTLRLGEMTWEVLHTPGHAAGVVCLYQREARLLLGSDHLIKHISSNAIIEPPEQEGAARRRPLVEYWASLRRVAEMDIGLVLSGHGEPIEDHRALIEKRFAFHQERLDNIRGVLSAGPQRVWAIVRALFPRLGGIDTFLAVSEILGHLDVMEEAGEVKRAAQNGVWRYELATIGCSGVSSGVASSDSS